MDGEGFGGEAIEGGSEESGGEGEGEVFAVLG